MPRAILQVGHTFIRGGDLPEQPHAQVGLLGADFVVANGRWQIAKVLKGENWNPELVSPLSQPGVDVDAGEYVFAVNGRPVTADAPIYGSQHLGPVDYPDVICSRPASLESGSHLVM